MPLDPMLLAPEVRPSQDESLPKIGPNLALNEDLSKKVGEHITRQFFIPYLMQAERLYPAWDRNDDIWRVAVKANNLDYTATELIKGLSGEGDINGRAPRIRNKHQTQTAKITPSAPHKQMDAITNLGVAISWENGQIPVQAKKPKHVYEHPLYNPTQQSVDAANVELAREAKEIDLKTKYRMSFGTFVQNGHAFALADFERELEAIKEYYTLHPDPEMANAQLAQLRQQYGYPEMSIEPTPEGRIEVCFQRIVPKCIRTDFVPLDRSAVFIDELIFPRKMDNQPCPIIRTHIDRWKVYGNRYDPQLNPFGWVNNEKALKENAHHWALSTPDEADLMARLIKRWNMSQTMGGQDAKNTIKQLWTAYAMLAIEESIDPETQQPSYRLDTGEGLECLHCQGRGKMEAMDPFDGTPSMQECPECKGQGRIFIEPKRYVVQFLGQMYSGYTMTCLRIQRNPTCKDRVPILYSCQLPEDMSTFRPVSKTEIATAATEMLTTGFNMFFDAKSRTINRGWKKRMDSPSWNVDCNAPNAQIPWESTADEVQRVESNTFDETETLLPMIQMMEKEVQDIFGANDTVVGEISSGRRAASEISLASEGSKRPLMNIIDQFGGDMMGGWGQFVLDNLEYWQDSDWIRKRTGQVTWGKVDLHTAVGEEMIRKSSAIEGYRYVLESAGANPMLQPVVPEILGKMLPLMGLEINPDVLDQGLKRNQLDAMTIVQRIMGEGDMTAIMPRDTDPHQVYVEVFKAALQDAENNPESHWFKHRQNLPLLQQRLMYQDQLLQMQLIQQQQQQLAQMAMESEAQSAGKGNQPERSKAPSRTSGEERQKTGR